MLMIDYYAYQSRWRTVSAARKVALYALCLGLAFGSPILGQWLLFALLLATTCYVVRLALVQYLRWLVIPGGFLLLSLAMIMLTSAPSIHASTNELLIAAPWFNGQFLGVSSASLGAALAAFSRSMACLAATLLFVLTTPFGQWAKLLQTARVPNVLIEQMVLIYRLIFIVIEEAQAIFRAQTVRFGYHQRGLWLRSLAMLVGLLFERVLLRQQQMESALAVKLYQGEFQL